jgi:hypothetical protein
MNLSAGCRPKLSGSSVIACHPANENGVKTDSTRTALSCPFWNFPTQSLDGFPGCNSLIGVQNCTSPPQARDSRLVACSSKKRDERSSAPICSFIPAMLSRFQNSTSSAGPYTPQTAGIMARLGSLKPHTLATMHRSSDCRQAFKDMAVALKEMFGNPASAVGTT